METRNPRYEVEFHGLEGTGSVKLGIRFDGDEFGVGMNVLVRRPGGSEFRAAHGQAVTAKELERFYLELRQLVADLSGEAKLETVSSENLALTVRLDKGKGTISGRIGYSEEPGMCLAFRGIRTDQSALQSSLADLRKLFVGTSGELRLRCAP